MAKLKLDLDDLGVESFDTTNAAERLSGTVRAHSEATEGREVCDDSDYYTCNNGSICLPESSLAPSCGGLYSCKCTYGGPYCGG
jgi:hypothetical protein